MSQMGQIAAMGQRTGLKDEPVVRLTRWVRKLALVRCELEELEEPEEESVLELKMDG